MACKKRGIRTVLIGGASVLALSMASVAAIAEEANFQIAAGDLQRALTSYIEQSGQQLIYRIDDVRGAATKGVSGRHEADDALELLLDETGFSIQWDDSGAAVIVPANLRRGALLRARDGVRVAQLDADTQPTGVERSRNTDDNEDHPEEIVVTGTNIRGVSPDSSPSFVYDREDIDKTGFGTVTEFIQSLPQNFGGGSNADVLSGLPGDRTAIQNVTAGSSVNLRGLGSGSTLVLLNGNRLAPSGNLGDFVDISLIPLSAIERVEVLTDGASAIYGADAIAGVVNFVLRDDYDGAETFVRFGAVTEGDLNEYRAGQTIGKSWNSGNALVSYEFFHRDSLSSGDRDFSSSVPLPNNLLPRQQNHNVLVSASQETGDRITLHGHGTYSERNGLRVIFDPFGLRALFADSKNKQYGGAVGADIALTDNWVLAVSGGYQRIDAFSRRRPPFLSQVQIDSDLWSVDGVIDGALFHLPGGDVKIAAGLSYREEAFSLTDGGLTNEVFRKDDRNVFGAFGEAYIPIVGQDNRALGMERLELTLAGRYDDYNDFGSTFNPKIGLLWSPLDGLNARGTYSTSFNPPNLGDTGSALGDVFTFYVPNPSSPTGTSLVLLDFRDNPDLGPEESTAWTAGLDYQYDVGPGDLDFSITWFDIRYTDRIGEAGNTFEYLADRAVFADVITANPDPAQTAAIIADAGDRFFEFSSFGGPLWTMPGDEEFILDGRLLNLAKADTSGLDMNIAYTVDADIGQLTFSLNSNYLFKQEKQITSNAPVFDVVDTVFNPVDLRMRGGASWNRGGWSASTFVNYVDSYVDDRNVLGADDLPIDSWTTVDISLRYDTGDRTGRRLIDNTRFSLSVLNLFNEDPPRIGGDSVSDSPTGFDPANASPLGRFISFQITKAW